MTDKPLTARIEVFRPGTFTPMGGTPITYSVADLRAIADAYDPQTAPAPVVIGHPDTNAPAFGWVDRFEYDGSTERLYADLGEIEPQFADLVKAGRFKKVSMAFFSPGQSHNPVPGTWYPKHVGFLGAAAPAVSGLRNAAFAGEADTVFTAAFGDRGFEETASILRLMRDFFIETFGLEAADRTLPAYRLEWLAEADTKPNPSGMVYAAPPDLIPNPKEKETAVTQPDPAFAAREADVAAREERLNAREAELASADNAAFADRMVAEGRLLPVSRDHVTALLNVLPGHAAVAFSEGAEKITPGAALRAILEAQPKIVTFGAMEIGSEEGNGAGAAFAADGKTVDAAGLATHNKALAYQRANPGTAYIAAVQAVA